MNLKLTKQHKTSFEQMLSDVIVYIESAIELNGTAAPRCRCGEYENIQSGYAAGSIIWYCPVCRADEEQS